MEKILDRLTEAGQEVTLSVSIRGSLSKDLVHGAGASSSSSSSSS